MANTSSSMASISGAKPNFAASELSETLKVIQSIGGSISHYDAEDSDTIVYFDSDQLSLSNRIHQISNDLEAMIPYIESEDSNLASTSRSLVETLRTIRYKIQKVCTDIMSEISKYALATLENEEGTENYAEEIGQSLEEINSMLDSL